MEAHLEKVIERLQSDIKEVLSSGSRHKIEDKMLEVQASSLVSLLWISETLSQIRDMIEKSTNDT